MGGGSAKKRPCSTKLFEVRGLVTPGLLPCGSEEVKHIAFWIASAATETLNLNLFFLDAIRF